MIFLFICRMPGINGGRMLTRVRWSVLFGGLAGTRILLLNPGQRLSQIA